MLPTRTGKLVTLREVELEDLPLVWEWENDSEMGLYLNADPGKRMSMDEVHRRFQQYRTDPTSGLFIICNDGDAIGMLGFDRLYKDIGTCRLFIGIGVKSHWGQGYGTIRGKPFIRLSIHPSRDEEHAHGFVKAFESGVARARRV